MKSVYFEKYDRHLRTLSTGRFVFLARGVGVRLQDFDPRGRVNVSVSVIHSTAYPCHVGN